jgi:hypothetical protein
MNHHVRCPRPRRTTNQIHHPLYIWGGGEGAGGVWTRSDSVVGYTIKYIQQSATATQKQQFLHQYLTATISKSAIFKNSYQYHTTLAATVSKQNSNYNKSLILHNKSIGFMFQKAKTISPQL